MSRYKDKYGPPDVFTHIAKHRGTPPMTKTAGYTTLTMGSTLVVSPPGAPATRVHLSFDDLKRMGLTNPIVGQVILNGTDLWKVIDVSAMRRMATIEKLELVAAGQTAVTASLDSTLTKLTQERRDLMEYLNFLCHEHGVDFRETHDPRLLVKNLLHAVQEKAQTLAKCPHDKLFMLCPACVAEHMTKEAV